MGCSKHSRCFADNVQGGGGGEGGKSGTILIKNQFPSADKRRSNDSRSL